MGDYILLGIFQIFAVANCFFGMRYLQYFDNSWFIWLYDVLWFLLGLISSLLGVVGLFLGEIFGAQDSRTQWTMQYHYLYAWLAIVVGYPCIVTHTWMAYHHSPIAHVHAALTAIPLVAWMRRKNRLIARTTIAAISIALVSHFCICYMASDVWGMLGALCMALNLTCLSIPVSYSCWDITAREGFVFGVGLSSIIFTSAVGKLLGGPKVKWDKLLPERIEPDQSVILQYYKNQNK